MYMKDATNTTTEKGNQAMNISDAERKALEMSFLGGAEALRTETYTCACSTVTSLMKKGLFDRDGLTAKGKAMAEQIANPCS